MIELDKIRLDPAEFGSQGNAVLGIRDSGKTYTATKLAEELFDAGIPFVAFDPIGVWRYLRVPGKGKGYPVVVAGGEEGDLPLTPASAPMIVEAAMQSGVSVVIDLFDMKLSKADWRRIVKDCIKLLLHKNKQYGLRHIFLEEAAEFAPQKIIDFDVYAEIEKLARMGGNSRLGYTLINQRAQEVNKAVLELCENLFLHRQKGANALLNVKKWLDVAGAAKSDLMMELPMLPSGECYAWLASSDTPVRMKVPEKKSLHPDRRVMHGDVAAIAAKKVNVGKFVSALTKALPALEEEKNAHDPVALRAEIAKLKRVLAAAQKASPPAWPDHRKDVERLQRELTAAQERAHELLERINAAARALGSGEFVAAVKRGGARPSRPPVSPAVASLEAKGVGKPAGYAEPRIAQPNGEGAAVPSGCAKPLATLAGVYPGGMTESQWATAAGYKKSGGTWGEYRRRLIRAAMIEQRGEQWYATELGAFSAGDVELPPEPGPELARWWAKRISGTPKMVEVLLESWPHYLSREELAERMDMIASGGSFGEYVRRLKRNNIAIENGAGVRLAVEVMGEA